MSKLNIELKEKFRKIPDLINEEFKKEGDTIPEIEKKFGIKMILDEEQIERKNQKRWFKKEIFDKKIANKLSIKIEELPKDKAGNTTYSKTIAREITKLRDTKCMIIDAKYGYPRYGTWRLATQEETRAILDFKNGNFLLASDSNPTIQKLQRRQLTNFLLKIYHNTCIICYKKGQEGLETTPIIPSNLISDIGKKEDVLNPKNYLLLCPYCKNAYCKKIVEIDEDFNLKITKKIEDEGRMRYKKPWINRLMKISKIMLTPEFQLNKKYLKLKKQLNSDL